MQQALTRREKILQEALAIEAEDALQAGTLSYLSKVLVQTTLPHSKVNGSQYSRSNGLTTLTIIAPEEVGLPYGVIPRLLVNFFTTQAVKTKSPEIILGDSLSEFMAALDMTPSGGSKGTIQSLRNQFERLLSSSISCRYDNPDSVTIESGMRIAKYSAIWWQPQDPNQKSLWQSKMVLSSDFFEEITKNPIPVDLRAIKALRKSPLALDLYAWLTYRFYSLQKKTCIPWEALHSQFGADYKELKCFKFKLCQQMKNILEIYPHAKVAMDSKGLILMPSPTHVKTLPKIPLLLDN